MPKTVPSSRSMHREQLIYLLTEAAELEHGLLCAYLFAGFSLRRDVAAMSDEERAAIERWRSSIREVAVEEMLHLVIVQNLLTAIGGAPHLQRPNFPVSPGLYPSGLVLQLRRFDEATLDHFVFLERPEGVEMADGEGFDTGPDHERGTAANVRLMASAQDYSSVGDLYRGIEDGFESLHEALGERQLFLGDPALQVGKDLIELDGLCTVNDLQSAKAAIAQIIEQGEGGRRAHETSHYDRFCAIRDEYKALKAARPTFEPAQPVAANPVMHRPIDPESCAFVSAPDASRILDLGNAAYGLMVQILARLFGAMDDTEARSVLSDVSLALMSKVLAPVAQLLATLPIGPSRAGQNAGLTFTLPRSTHAYPHRGPAWTLLWERAVQLEAVCRHGRDFGVLDAVGDQLQQVAEQLRAGRDRALRSGSAT